MKKEFNLKSKIVQGFIVFKCLIWNWLSHHSRATSGFSYSLKCLKILAEAAETRLSLGLKNSCQCNFSPKTHVIIITQIPSLDDRMQLSYDIFKIDNIKIGRVLTIIETTHCPNAVV